MNAFGRPCMEIHKSRCQIQFNRQQRAFVCVFSWCMQEEACVWCRPSLPSSLVQFALHSTLALPELPAPFVYVCVWVRLQNKYRWGSFLLETQVERVRAQQHKQKAKSMNRFHSAVRHDLHFYQSALMDYRKVHLCVNGGKSGKLISLNIKQVKGKKTTNSGSKHSCSKRNTEMQNNNWWTVKTNDMKQCYVYFSDSVMSNHIHDFSNEKKSIYILNNWSACARVILFDIIIK